MGLISFNRTCCLVDGVDIMKERKKEEAKDFSQTVIKKPDF
jgi:hypothetical protein